MRATQTQTANQNTVRKRAQGAQVRQSDKTWTGPKQSLCLAPVIQWGNRCSIFEQVVSVWVTHHLWPGRQLQERREWWESGCNGGLPFFEFLLSCHGWFRTMVGWWAANHFAGWRRSQAPCRCLQWVLAATAQDPVLCGKYTLSMWTNISDLCAHSHRYQICFIFNAKWCCLLQIDCLRQHNA